MIQLQNLTLRRGAKVLLDGASITIHPGEKVGLVGRNGAGKSTLFALLNGSLHEDGGDFSMHASWQLARVAPAALSSGAGAWGSAAGRSSCHWVSLPPWNWAVT